MGSCVCHSQHRANTRASTEALSTLTQYTRLAKKNEMGTKFSKTLKGEKTLDCVGDESSDTFNKTSTLPATFKKKDEEVNKAGTLPRGGLDRSTSFSKRFRKSMTRLVGHKKVNDDAKPVTEPVNAISEDEVKEENNEVEKVSLKEEVEPQEEEEDDVKMSQKKARAQFFENMYNSGEPVNIPKPPRTNLPSGVEKVIEEEEEEEIETVSVSVIGTPVVKLIDKHEEGNETQQESAELSTDAAAAAGEVVDLIVKTTEEMVASESKQAEVHEEVNDQSEVQLANSEETTTAEPVEEKIITLTTEKLETKDEINMTCIVNEGTNEENKTVLLESEQKVEHPEKIECEGKHDNSETSGTIEGVNSKNEMGKDEQPKLKESGLELTQEVKDEKSDFVIEAAVIQDVCTEETAGVEFDGKVDEVSSKKGDNMENTEERHLLEENMIKSNELKSKIETEEKEENKEINNELEAFEIVTSDMIDDMEESGASSLETKCDSRTDDLSSEGGITTDEGIVGSDDEEKDEDETLKAKMCKTSEPSQVSA